MVEYSIINESSFKEALGGFDSFGDGINRPDYKANFLGFGGSGETFGYYIDPLNGEPSSFGFSSNPLNGMIQ